MTHSRKWRLTVVGALAIAAAPAAAQRTGSVWLPSWVMDRAYPATIANAGAVRTASPFWYDARSCDRIVGAPGAGDRHRIAGLHARGLRVVPSVTATGLSPTAAVACLASPTRRAGHVARLAAIVASRDYDGVDIDYEHLALTISPAQAARVRGAFTAFVTDLCTVMRARGRDCVITVMPRTSDRPDVWRGKLIPAVYDYPAIVSSATTMRVMAYDQHAGGTRPGPIAGLGWVRRVAAYTASVAPVERVELGVPTYGRDWTGTAAKSISGPAAVALAARHRAVPRFDPVQGEMTFTYVSGGRRHVVWWSGPRSVALRAALARRTGFAGTAVWAAGLEQPGVWTALRERP